MTAAGPGPRPAAAAAGPAPLGRRLLALVYEAMLLAAVLWCATLPLQIAEAGLKLQHSRVLLQLYLVAVAGAYFVWQWTRGGQTLAMKTWRLQLVDGRGSAPSLRQAVLRYLLALAGLAVFGSGFLWALVDRERSFLHDRLAGTRIVRAP